MLSFLKILVIGIFVSKFFINNFLKDLFCGKTTLSKSSIKKYIYIQFLGKIMCLQWSRKFLNIYWFLETLLMSLLKNLMIYMHYMLKFQIFNDVHYFQVATLPLQYLISYFNG
jgi:hypothetical protein